MSNMISFDNFKTASKNHESLMKSTFATFNTNNFNTNNNASTPQKDDSVELKNKLEEAKKQNGLIEKLADKIKGAVGFGANSKKLERTIEEGSNKQEVEKEIHKYKLQQENTAQGIADIASGAASIGVFFKAKQELQKQIAKTFKINKDSMERFERIKPDTPLASKVKEIAKNNINKKWWIVTAAAIGAGIAGGFIKKNLLKLNRIGTEQYKPQIDDSMGKDEIKQTKKEAKKGKRNANFRNVWSGRINGFTTPLLTIPVAGVPLYLAINSLNKYFIANRTDRKNKSINSYIENLKSSPIEHATTAAALAIPAVKKSSFDSVFEKNLDKVAKNLSNIEFRQNTGLIRTYDQLENIILGDKEIEKIIYGELSNDEKIKQLTQKNIFAVKFKQIQNANDDLTRMLKEACPESRTLKEAKELIQKTYADKYEVTERVGVGTVAETYLAKDKATGAGVCIKILKDGITQEKILQDKEKFLAMIDALEDKSEQEKIFLKANIEDIAKGILAEVDFNNEMKAAQELAKVTKKAKVVKPIEVKDNIYVMEKADGISLQTFIEGPTLLWEKGLYEKEVESYKKLASQSEIYQKELENYQTKLKEVENKLSKGATELTKSETKKLLEAYQDVYVEQFSKIDANGKIIHGDIHPGNIFIDIEALKRGDKKFLTLIDTGNTIQQDSKNAIRFMNLTKYVNNGDYENIAKFVLNGASLPEGLSQDKAVELVSEELKNKLFDNQTHIGCMNNDSMLALTDEIMQKHNIIPSDTQGNLIKSKESAQKSMQGFFGTYLTELEEEFERKKGSIDENKKLSFFEQIKLLFTGGSTLAEMGTAFGATGIKQKRQEMFNLLKFPLKEISKLKRSASTPKKNSEEYLNYIIKQAKKTEDLVDKAN